MLVGSLEVGEEQKLGPEPRTWILEGVGSRELKAEAGALLLMAALGYYSRISSSLAAQMGEQF